MRLIALVLITLLSEPLAEARGLPSQPQPPAANIQLVPSADPIDSPPSPADTMSAYRTLDTWVRALSVPDTAPDTLLPVTGAFIMLRLDGQIIARGTSISPLPDRANLWSAARIAIAEAKSRLPHPTDLLQQEAAAATAKRLTISLELAGPLTPIHPAPNTYADAELTLAPGLDGVAVRFGPAAPARYAAVFPSQMLSTNTLPHQSLATAASLAAGDASMGVLEPNDLRAKHGAAMFRFRTTQLAQQTVGDEPNFLARGQRCVPVADITTDELRRLAEVIIGHFVAIGDAEVARTLPEAPTQDERGLVGHAIQAFHHAVRPLTDREERGLAVLILLPEYRKPLAEDAIDTAFTAIALTNLTESILRRRQKEGDEVAPLGDVWGEQTERLAKVFSPDTGFSADLPSSARGLVALATTNIAVLEAVAGAPPPGKPSAIVLAEAMVRRLFRDTPPDQLVSQMPWLGWAELRLADLKFQISNSKSQPASRDIPSAIALRHMREQVWQHMLTEADCGPDNQDLVGGIVFNKTKVLLPTWQSARPLAFIATMLADDRLTTEGEFNEELVRLLNALRFLRQLQADESTMWMYPNRERALGGIRAAPWDQRMPVDASAMTLLAVCETLKSLEKRAAAAAKQPSPQPPATAPVVPSEK